ncbi:hypothetical protein GGH19_001123 [Coemansia sp. RSA 1807]|nr:hypothetical protein LPJ62_005713 [Coemansia sp. RSA 2167]KAJ2165776.1 hypothetical protein GGH15_003163 [Coemansia sp. RSA 562]KAJ2186928.1 hypothetical protein EV181_003039 [Coemansia sp. RSA 532]KAJ2201327.1 hypothetical protein IW144_000448 [Coemansia sp. RSA 522]KAJ2227994.1 hypothetical protein EV180_002204 [Coemansia sp. RSA 518]KAJ2275470.1 hypothetical protein J3F81_001800 [Coemansia sp. RSA 371]KAJ2277952.1 hypothetical protein EV176_001939 [Coemansia sp. RSA 451]KAJ2281244.1 hy
MSKLAAKILTKSGIPPTVEFVTKPKTLPELLNVQRLNAYKMKVMPTHWFDKGFDDCYYEVHRVKYKRYLGEPTHGKAWGILTWKGKQVNDQPRKIQGGLKFNWKPYESPHAQGIYYDAEKAPLVERRRSNMLKAYSDAKKQEA